LKKIPLIIVTILIGLSAGVFSALIGGGLVGGKFFNRGEIVEIDGWVSDWTIGSKSANPYVRTWVARRGLFALSKEEAIYFIRSKDDRGLPLREECNYEIIGIGQDAYWWSITLYDSESRLALNQDEAHSVDASNIYSQGANNKDWSVSVSSDLSKVSATKGQQWISSRNAGVFDLTLRLYRPSKAVLQKPEITLKPPHVNRLSCEGAPI